MKYDSILWFLKRFTLMHVLTYLIFGILFMLITDYFTVFSEHEIMKDIMRESDSIWVRISPLVQILRGLLLGIVIYPFREIIFNTEKGWLKLFGLLWVLTGIGAVITGPGSIEGMLYTNLGFGNPLIGLPEVTFQMLAFSYFFVKFSWRRKNE